MNNITGQPLTQLHIPCCLCGTSILPNGSNKCGACLAQEFDLSSILQRGPQGGELTVYQCRQCRRYHHTENHWVYHEPESPQLLALCLKHVPALSSSISYRTYGISSMTLIDSSWIWTEPHSMRLKLRLTIRADVGESPRTTTVQQRTPVELHVRWKQCPDCNREYTNRTWHALVQLRQKHPDNGSKKGLLMMEAVIRQNEDIRKHIISMETSRHGFDFYFLELMHARAFASFLASCLPMKIKTSQKLVSEDLRNNSANVKSTTICEMVPLCRDDLIICDKAAGSGCNIKLSGRMCIVNKVSSTLQLVDAAPARTNIQDMFATLHQEKYWKGESHYRIVFSGRRMVKFVVMDVDLCDPTSSPSDSDLASDNDTSKYALADVTVARESEFGQTDETLQCTTHLGRLLEIGDTVLGYDLVNSVLPAAAEWSIDNALHSSFQLPDVVLVKKIHSAGGRGGEVFNEAQQELLDKPKAKSSGSKRREKRKQKQEKKMKELAEAADRMGLGGVGNEAGEDDWEQERKAFEEELKNDIELAAEFRSMVEKEIDMAKGALDSLLQEEEENNEAPE